MKKVISFCLWGNNKTYNIGAIKNAELAKIHYPDFECWFYIHKESVPESTILQLNKLDNTYIIFKKELDNPMLWRFEAIEEEDVEINMSRDTDTRILLREKLAVDEWIKSGKLFHIMRDHPHHMNKNTPIMGGMFGTRKIPSFKWSKNFNKNLSDKGRYLYNKDQDYLSKYVYPIIKYDSFIHSSFGKLFNDENVNKFPIEYCKDYLFVGGYVYYDDTVSNEHINILKNN